MSVFVVWEPVILTDIAPPGTRTLARCADRRVSQWWDPDRALSSAILEAARASPAAWKLEESGVAIEEGTIVWDAVLFLRRGAFWSDAFPVPAFAGFPVVDAAGGLRAILPAEGGA